MLWLTLLVQSARRGRQLWRRRLAGVLRVTCLLLAVVAGLGVYEVRTARAELGEGSLAFGRELGRLLGRDAETHALRLNGEMLYVSSGTTDQSVPTVLERLAQRCKEERGPMPFIVRGGDGEREGIAMCFVRSKTSASGAAQALRSFRATRDLAALGDLRYVYARRVETGATHLLSVWTDGPFRLDRLVAPGDGDQCGEPSCAPPVAGAVRLLRASVNGGPYALTVYEATPPAEPMLLSYEAAMRERGYALADSRRGEGGEEARVFLGEMSQVLVTASPHQGKTLIAVGETVAVPVEQAGPPTPREASP